jgi:uncharacterized protein YegL
MERQSLIITLIVVAICIALALANFAYVQFGPCKADVMLMLDDSGSVEDEDFDNVKDFVKKLANDDQIKEQMDKENIQFGIATFSSCAKWMDQKESNQVCDPQAPAIKYVHNSYSMNEMLKKYKRMGSFTDMIRALEFVNQQMMKHARPSSDKMLLFMTDGKSQNSDNMQQDIQTIGKIANNLKEKGVQIFVISVGENTSQTELQTISSATCESEGGVDSGRVCEDTAKYIIKVGDYSKLDSVIEDLAGHVCNHQYWMCSIPIVIAILFVVLRIWLDRREVNKLKEDAENMTSFTPGMTGTRK